MCFSARTCVLRHSPRAVLWCLPFELCSPPSPARNYFPQNLSLVTRSNGPDSSKNSTSNSITTRTGLSTSFIPAPSRARNSCCP
ncbi:hypothetical protein T439DRAFT_128294 [Meredithblackwellia eburnea MCA 4105]